MNQNIIDAVRPYLNNENIVIDVGCHKGHFLDGFTPNFPIKTAIGIDPIDYQVGHKYTRFYENVIFNGEPKEIIINLYEEPGCNSILKMRAENVVHDRNQKGWYVGWNIEGKTGEKLVQTTTLEKIIEENELSIVDFLKIDAQGYDIEVVKSAGKCLRNIRFVQLECVSSHDKDVTLYDGQQLMEQDIEDMDKLGFSVLAIADYSANASPEADIVFYNRDLVSLKE